MNYSYDVLINMNEDNVFSFYEWENYDPIELIKKIPLYKVNSKTLKDFYLFEIKVEKDFLNTLQDKTIIKNNKINKTIKYACMLCDTKNVLVVEFDDDGTIFSRSTLLLEDEANIIEYIYNYKEEKIKYQKLGIKKINNKLRQEELVKKVILVELNTILDNNNESKLKYLFNEWFGYEESNINKIKSKIKDEINKEINTDTKRIYDLIVLSYSKS